MLPTPPRRPGAGGLMGSSPSVGATGVLHRHLLQKTTGVAGKLRKIVQRDDDAQGLGHLRAKCTEPLGRLLAP